MRGILLVTGERHMKKLPEFKFLQEIKTNDTQRLCQAPVRAFTRYKHLTEPLFTYKLFMSLNSHCSLYIRESELADKILNIIL
jgi:hypothetical protein